MSALQSEYRVDECGVCGNTFYQERRRGRPYRFCEEHRGQPVQRESRARLTLVPPLRDVEIPKIRYGKRKHPLWVYPRSTHQSLGLLLVLIRQGETLEETSRRVRATGHAYTRKVVDAKHFQSEGERLRILRHAKIDERMERGIREVLNAR